MSRQHRETVHRVKIDKDKSQESGERIHAHDLVLHCLGEPGYESKISQSVRHRNKPTQPNQGIPSRGIAFHVLPLFRSGDQQDAYARKGHRGRVQTMQRLARPQSDHEHEYAEHGLLRTCPRTHLAEIGSGLAASTLCIRKLRRSQFQQEQRKDEKGYECGDYTAEQPSAPIEIDSRFLGDQRIRGHAREKGGGCHQVKMSSAEA